MPWLRLNLSTSLPVGVTNAVPKRRKVIHDGLTITEYGLENFLVVLCRRKVEQFRT